jgi:multidrug transporter EmrE-like cation transporter
VGETVIQEFAEFPVVVVPEGLAFDAATRRALTTPSFVSEAVLQRVLGSYTTRRILIAPANSFGAPLSENEVMAAWLTARGCASVQTPLVTASGYIDTWGNAVELRRWLDERGQWPLGPFVLVSAFRHARRARLCFSRNGFTVASVDTVTYPVEGRPIVPRLFYYNWPILHQAYETLALVRDRIRSANAGVKKTMIGWLALTCAILFNTLGNFFIKHFSLTTEVQNVLSYLNPWFVFGIVSFGVNVFFYSRALKDIPLVIAYPILTGVSMSLVAIFAVFFLREKLGLVHAAGIALVILGVSCLAWAE